MSVHSHQSIAERRAHVDSTISWAERHGYLPKGQSYWTSDGKVRKLVLGAHSFTLAEAEAYCDGISAVMNHLPLVTAGRDVPADPTSKLPIGTWSVR